MKFKLTIHPAIEAGNQSIEFMFDTELEAQAAHESCADLLLFLQDTAHVMQDFSNMFVIEEKINGEWVELED